jgi:hypothetical protein
MKRQTHLTAQQIADLKLEGMPTSARRVRSWAEDRGWEFIAKPDNQGGRHFAISSLPASAQADLKARWAGQRKAAPSASNTHDGPGRSLGDRACRALAAALQTFADEMWGDA